MDEKLRMVELMLRHARDAAADRHTQLEASRPRMSRHYSTLAHTKHIISLLDELLLAVKHDPDNWDEEPESVPF